MRTRPARAPAQSGSHNGRRGLPAAPAYLMKGSAIPACRYPIGTDTARTLPERVDLAAAHRRPFEPILAQTTRSAHGETPVVPHGPALRTLVAAMKHRSFVFSSNHRHKINLGGCAFRFLGGTRSDRKSVV